MTTLEKIRDLREGLELIGLEPFIIQLEDIKLSHLKDIERLTPKPKKVVKKEPAKKFEVIITENGKSNTISFDTESALDKFLKIKQAERQKRIDLFLKSEGITVLSKQRHYHDRDRYEAQLKYSDKLKTAGLDFHIEIKQC